MWWSITSARPFHRASASACKGGRILTVGNTGGPKFEIDNRFIFGKHLSILGSSMGTRQDFAQVMELVFAGKLKPVLDQDFPLQEAAAAQEHLASGEQLGKVTLDRLACIWVLSCYTLVRQCANEHCPGRRIAERAQCLTGIKSKRSYP